MRVVGAVHNVLEALEVVVPQIVLHLHCSINELFQSRDIFGFEN